jgi:hypothetical protein
MKTGGIEMTTDPKTIALAYVNACGRKDLDAVAQLLAPDLEFQAVFKSIRGVSPFLDALRQIGPIWVRSDAKKAFTDGNEVCVMYDLVTDTPAGPVPCIEWLRIEDGRIRWGRLFFDRLAFQPAMEELERRLASRAAANA